MKSSHVCCLQFAKSFHMLHKLQISEWSHKRTWRWELSSAFYGEENKLREIYLLQITKFYLFYPILQKNIPIYQLHKKKKKNQRRVFQDPGVYHAVHFSHVWLSVTLCTRALQGPWSMGFSRQEYWSGLPCPSPGDLPNPGTESVSLTFPALASRFFTTSDIWEAKI